MRAVWNTRLLSFSVSYLSSFSCMNKYPTIPSSGEQIYGAECSPETLSFFLKI